MKVGDKVGRCLFANRPCDRVVGRQADTVFIAAPSADEYHWEVIAAKDVVAQSGLRPEVAVHKQLLSEEIFCEKICTYIVESRFCIVFATGCNPNVFYEYGLMRPLRKRVISLQRADEKPAFNVQHLDTVRYRQTTLREMLTDAVEAATSVTGAPPSRVKRHAARRSPAPFTERVFKVLELEGVATDVDDACAEAAEGTAFVVRSGRDGTYFTAVMEAEWNVEDLLADTIIVCRRLGRGYSTLRKALKVRQAKEWRKGARQDQDRIDVMEHLHFVYATSRDVPDSSKDGILAAIRELRPGFPLPTVEIWSSQEVNARFAALVGVGK